VAAAARYPQPQEMEREDDVSTCEGAVAKGADPMQPQDASLVLVYSGCDRNCGPPTRRIDRVLARRVATDLEVKPRRHGADPNIRPSPQRAGAARGRPPAGAGG
jgi:hypothetical protein